MDRVRDVVWRSVDGVGSAVIEFGVMVSGQHASDASLKLDEPLSVPAVRRQVVDFENGQMRLIERYANVDLDATLDESHFDL